jgi:hypothetical protein
MYIAIGAGVLVVIGVCVVAIRYEAAQTRQAIRESTANAVSDGMNQSIEKITSPQNALDKVVNTNAANTANEAFSKLQTVLTAGDGSTGLGDLPSKAPEMAAEAMKPAAGLVREGATQLKNAASDLLGGEQSDENSAKGGKKQSPLGGIVGEMRGIVEDVAGDALPVSGRRRSDDPSSTSAPNTEGNEQGSAPKSKQASTDRDEAPVNRRGDKGTKGRGEPDADVDSERPAATAKPKFDDPKLNPLGVVRPGGSGRGALNPLDVFGPEAGGKGGLTPLDVANTMLRGSSRATEIGDRVGKRVFRLSVDDEKRWGKRLHEQVIAGEKVVNNPDLKLRIRQITAPLLKNLERPEIEYTFTVLQSDKDDLNAFSLPGGYVYLHSAIVDFADDDLELQTVLAHEIGHVDLRHCAEKLTYGARVSDLTSPAVGDAVATLHSLLARPYDRNEEFAADQYGFEATILAGQSREEALSFPRRFAKWIAKQEREEGDNGAAKNSSVFSAVMERTDNHFNTHPPMQERIRRLEAIDVDAIRSTGTSGRRGTAE